MDVAFRWAGAVVGVVAALVAARSGDLGVGLMVAAPLFGFCTLIGVLAGELTVRPQLGATRTAAVEVRRIVDYLPRRLGGAVVAGGGTLVTLLAVTMPAGSADDLGRVGRALTRQCAPGMVESHTPWPGRFYAARLAVVLVAGLVLAVLAMRTIVLRARTGDSTADDAQRRRAAGVATGTVGVLLAIPLAGVSLTAATALLGFSCAPVWWAIAGWALLVLAAAALALVSWCVVAIIAPARRAEPVAVSQ